jgi:arylsulfatase A-like enzyme
MSAIPPVNKPHVVVIMADQLRYDVLGGPYTPHLNALAQESHVFDRAYCASPLCVPARGAFFTGTYPNVSGCLINPWEPTDARHGKVRTGISSLYSLMETDWDSWNIGKQHFLTEEGIQRSVGGTGGATRWTAGMKEYKQYLRDNGRQSPGGSDFKAIVPEMAGGRVTRAKAYSTPTVGCYEPGFDYFFDGFFARNAVEAIRQRNTEKPMLLNTMFLAPHPPFDIPEPWFSRWSDIDIPDNVGRWASDQSPLQLYNLTGAIGTHYRREEWCRIWQVYVGLVSLLDECVGMIINELKAQGMYDNSLILFTSDHGEMLGSHGLWQKMCMYEESVRTPLYVKFPKSREQEMTESTGNCSNGNHRVADPVSAVDILPTLCDYLGLETPAGINGTSLMPLIQGNSLDREHVFIQYDGNGARGNFQRCILNRNHKLIVDIFKDEIYLELYDLEQDLQEQCNLAFDADYSDLVMKLLTKLRTHMKNTRDLIDLPEPELLYRNFLVDYSPFRK